LKRAFPRRGKGSREKVLTWERVRAQKGKGLKGGYTRKGFLAQKRGSVF